MITDDNNGAKTEKTTRFIQGGEEPVKTAIVVVSMNTRTQGGNKR